MWDVFREYPAQAPDTVSMIFSIAPAHAADASVSTSAEPVVVVSFNHSGRADRVEQDTAGLRQGPSRRMQPSPVM